MRCAALRVGPMALFAAEGLSHRPRRNGGPIYFFAANAETGEIAFRGSRSSFGASERNPELFLGAHEVL